MKTNSVMEVGNANFKSEVLLSDKLVLVDFWAENCPHCDPVARIVEELASEYEGVVKVTKLKVNDHLNLANKYAVFSVPRLLLFNDGQVVDIRIGARPKDRYQEMIERALATT